MKITDHIQNAKGKTLFSFELLPPAKGQGIQSIFKTMDELMEFKPPFIDVTYHREDYIYKEHASGLLERVFYRKRPGTVAICAAIMNKYKVDAVPHLICGGFTKEETENALIDLNFLGIDNVLVLRGDARKGDADFIPTEGGHAFAADLLEQVADMNKGRYLHEDIVTSEKTDFCIGVAGYPEKHFESPNFNTDFKYLKQNQNTFLVPEIPSNNNGDVDKNFHSGSIAQMGVNFNDTNFDEMLDLLDDIAKFKESPILWNDTKTCDLNDSDDKEQDLTLCNKCDVKISCGYYGKNQLEILKKGE